MGYDKLLDWSPWKEPLPTRSWLTTPPYPPVGTVLWTSQIAPILEPVFFRFLGLQTCSATPHVLTGASMRGVPNRVFFTWGYIGVVFTHLLVRSCPFLGGNNCQHMPALVSVQWIGARGLHWSKLQRLTLSTMTREVVPPLPTLSGAVLETQWDRVGHVSSSDRSRRPVVREKEKDPHCLSFETRAIWYVSQKTDIAVVCFRPTAFCNVSIL